MTSGNSQGLYIVVAIVIFGIFTLMAYILFEDTLSPGLAALFGDSTSQAQQSFKPEDPYNVEDVIPTEESEFEFDGINKIIGYKGTETEVVIPNEIDGKPVVRISGDAFNDKNLTKVIMPNSLEYIEDGTVVDKNVKGAFANNEIKEISFSANLKYIGTFAFFSGGLNEDIVLPDGLEEIGESAFAENDIGDLVLPKTVAKIGNKAFANNNIGQVTFEDGGFFESSDLVEMGKDAFSGNKLTTVEIPKGTTKIADNAFKDNGLKTVEIPKGVEIIGKNAFSNNGLTEVNIPSGVRIIQEDAFRNNKLKEVKIPSTVTDIDAGSFAENDLTSVRLPEGLENIGPYAFYKNQLPVINLPNSLLSVGTYAFYENKLTGVSIPPKLSKIEAWTFAYNEMTKKPNIPSNILNEEEHAFYGNPFPVEIPIVVNGVTHPSYKTYYDKYTPTSNSSFEYRLNDTGNGIIIVGYVGTSNTVTIPENMVYNGKSYPVTEIGDYAFNRTSSVGKYTKTSISSLIFPSTLEKIGNYSFYSQTGIRNAIVIPPKVNYIGKYAFYMGQFSSLTFNNAPTKIDDFAFQGNDYLSTLDLGNNITSIGKQSFDGEYSSSYSNKNLKTVKIPKSVKSIGAGAFKSNTELKDVYLDDANTSPLIENPTNVFTSTPTVHYEQPFRYTQSGVITDYWGIDTVLKIPRYIGSVAITEIGDYAFSRNSGHPNNTKTSFSSIEIPNSIVKIGDSAFYSQTAIRGTVTIPDSVVSIGKYAFYMGQFSKLVFENSPTVIHDYAFQGNDYLSTLELGNNITSIGKQSFDGEYSSSYSNKLLKTVKIPKSVKSIGANAFKSNTELKDVYLDDANTSPLNENPTNVFTSSPNVHYVQPFKYTSLGVITDYWGLGTNVEIPSEIKGIKITEIGDYAFSRSSGHPNNTKTSFSSIKIPNSIVKIGDYAFYSQTAIRGTVTIPDSVVSIGKYAFYMGQFSKLVFENSPTVVHDFAFQGNDYLSTLDLGNNIQSIGKQSFDGEYSSSYSNKNLKTVKIPKSVKSIGAGAFKSNTELKDVYLEDANTSPLNENPSNVFTSSPNVHYVQPFRYTQSGVITDYWGLVTNVEIPSEIKGVKITEIGDYAFSRNSGHPNNTKTSFSSIKIPNSIVKIGDYAFYSQTAIRGTVTIPKSVTSIGKYAFYMGQFSKLVFDNSPTVVHDFAFQGNDYLSTLDLGNNIQSIGKQSFDGQYSSSYSNKLLKTVKIPKSVKSIGANAFKSNTELKRVDISPNAYERLLKGKESTIFTSTPKIYSIPE